MAGDKAVVVSSGTVGRGHRSARCGGSVRDIYMVFRAAAGILNSAQRGIASVPIFIPRDKVVLISLLLNIGRASNLGGRFGPEIKFCDGWLLRTGVASLKQNRAMARPT